MLEMILTKIGLNIDKIMIEIKKSIITLNFKNLLTWYIKLIFNLIHFL